MCDDELRGKKLKALIPPSSGARYWSADYAERNQSVVNQRITGDNTRWKSITGYHRRSIAATARYRVNLCIKQDAARRYARKCTPCLKDAHLGDSLFQIRFIQQSPALCHTIPALGNQRRSEPGCNVELNNLLISIVNISAFHRERR